MRARERDPSILHCCTEVSTRNRMPGKCCLNQNFASLCEKTPLMLTGSELRICLFPQRRQVQKKSAGKPALIFCRVTGEHLLKLAATLAIPGVCPAHPSLPTAGTVTTPFLPPSALLRFSMAAPGKPRGGLHCLPFGKHSDL